MRIIVDVYDTANTRLGSGPVDTILSASVKRTLDGAGTIRLDFPAVDVRVLDLIQNERRVRIYAENDGVQRELGRGVIRTRRTAAEDDPMVSIEGPDSLDALTRRSVLLNRQYTNQTIATIADNLISLVPGWSASVEAGVADDLQTARFDGTSVLKALIRVCEEKGIHLREGSAANTLELGAFGSQSTITLTNTGSLNRAIHSNDEIILIDRLSVIEDSGAIANWIVPLGAGEGQAALTLKNSTRTSPYTIQSMTGPDGQTLYYLQDDASIAANGQIEKIVTIKTIAPISNSDTAKELAANALYDAAAAWLQRNSQRQFTYQVSGVKAREQVRPGDKIRLVYKGEVYRNNMPVAWLDVDDWFWVLSVTETVNSSGLSISLEISSIDKQMEDAAQTVVGALEAIDVRNVSVQTYSFYYQDSGERTIMGGVSTDADKAAEWTLKLPDMLTDIIQVRFQFITRPPYALTDEQWNLSLPNTPQKYYYISNGAIVGSVYPSRLSMLINGIDVTSVLDPSSTWNQAGENAALDITVDITDYILNAVGGIFQTHTLKITAGAYASNVDLRVNTSYNSALSTHSIGIIEGKFLVLGIGQAILPS